MSRRLARTLLGGRAAAPLLNVLERAESRRPNLLRALTYHRVDNAGAFERQMRHLAERYHVAGAADLLEALGGRRRLPPRSVLITFDDGYREVGEVAWPILRALGLPAVLFVPTAYPGDMTRTFWWDLIEDGLRATTRRDVLDSPAGALPLGTAAQRRRAGSVLKRSLKSLHHDLARERAESICRELGVFAPTPTPAPSSGPPQRLDWEELRRLSRDGMVIAPHSRTHPFMDLLGTPEAHEEVAGSLADLRRELGAAPPPLFSYPDGRYGPAAVAALRDAGIVAAFTTRRGTNDLDADDPLTLRRINISPGADVAVLRARLVHSSIYLNRWRPLFDPQRRPPPERRKPAMPRKARPRVLVCRALDAAMTASLRPKRRLAAQLQTLVSPRSSNYDRVAAAVNAIDRLIPGIATRATARICRPMDLPFPAQRVELLAIGSGATVFLAADHGAARVVKVYRRSLGVPRDRLPAVLDRYREQYDQVCRLYQEAPGVVWPSQFIIIGGPILGRPAVACVQEYIPGRLRDFFSDLTEGQALEALRACGELRRQFLAFAAPTLELYRTQARCPDFLGRHNLTVAGEGAAARLRLIDYRIMPAAADGGRAKSVRQRQERCLQRIGSLKEALE